MATIPLLIGCPILKRAWIVRQWYQHAVTAALSAGVEPTFVFVGDPVVDSETFEAFDEVSSHPLVVRRVEEGGRAVDLRDWRPERFNRMVFLRNQLLDEVRLQGPDYFLSLDSDILLHPEALTSMMLHLRERAWGAIGSRTYMDSTSRCYPSYAFHTRSGTRRPDFEGVCVVDVIMAIKLMTPSAYAVDYEYNFQGEDVGWSKAARGRGVKLGWDGTHCSKHVMGREQLHSVDERAGY